MTIVATFVCNNRNYTMRFKIAAPSAGPGSEELFSGVRRLRNAGENSGADPQLQPHELQRRGGARTSGQVNDAIPITACLRADAMSRGRRRVTADREKSAFIHDRNENMCNVCKLLIHGRKPGVFTRSSP